MATTSGARPTVQATIAVVVTILAGAAVAFGAPTWLVLVAAALPWIPTLASRVGASVGIAVIVILELWILLSLLMITASLRLPMVPAVIIVWTALGLVGCAVLYSSAPMIRLPLPEGLTVSLGSLVGGLIWLATQGLAAVVPGATRVSWVMRGDSANNLLFARQIVSDLGVKVGSGENPVPLPAALIAVVMDAGRSAILPADLARHDVSAFAQTWTLCIIITCLLAGLAAGSIARLATSRRAVLALASITGSLIPVSWFVTGYSLEFGFFSTHVALPLVFAAVIMFLGAERRPAVTLGLLALTGTGLLAVWSPLVMVPAVLGAIVLVRFRRQLLASRGFALAVLLVGLVQLLGYGLTVVLPVFLVNATSLDAGGGVIEFPRLGIVVAIITIGIIVSAVLAFPNLRHPAISAVLGVMVALAAAIGALLLGGGASVDPWGYYPMKLLWMSSTILIVLLVGTAAAALARLPSRPLLQRSGVGVIAVGLIAVLAYAPAGSTTPHLNPVGQILGGVTLGPGDEVAERIFTLADAERSHFLWKSGDPFEQQVNLWVMQLWADSLVGNFDLRYAAYGLYDHDNINELCRIVGLLGGSTVVHTAEPDLAARVSVACPQQRIEVAQG